MTIQEKAIEQLERVSNHLAAIGEKEDYTEIAIQALELHPKNCHNENKEIDMQPTADVKPIVHAHWDIIDQGSEGDECFVHVWGTLRCSNCGMERETEDGYMRRLRCKDGGRRMSWFSFELYCVPLVLVVLETINLIMTFYIGRAQDKELEELRFRIRKLEILNGWEEVDNEKP